jgi:cellulose synthase/poly-beta-1,6-N-acetylglucosamine synthase-like glycosyltransferase
MSAFSKPSAHSDPEQGFYFGAIEPADATDVTSQSLDDPHGADGAESMSLHLLADLEKQLLQHRANAVCLEWSPVCRRLQFEPEVAQRIAERAALNGTNFAREAIVCGAVDEYRLFNAIAADLRLPYLPDVDPRGLLLDEAGCLLGLSKHNGLPLASFCRADGQLIYLLARMDIGLNALRARIRRYPDLARNLYIAAPTALRNALRDRAKNRLMLDAQHRLTLEKPEFSARHVANAGQGAVAGALIVILAMCLAMAPERTVFVIQAVGMLAFLSCVLLRLFAMRTARPLKFVDQPVPNPADLPVYSVLVALYREREVITQLLISLGKLQWPHGKLEIRLVCEEDDTETLEILQTHELRPFIELVKVPQGGPRTKPKALAYALPLCSGEYVTLYDAEDRPHPMQLIEAWRAFERDTPDLACVQAPLVVTNQNESLLSLMFAFEYAALFRGLLPWLAQKDAVLPLGGTSNHFRRSALMDVGGWDGHNVTEDADLGLRLKRFGYRIGVIGLPTLEEAPEDFRTWMPQRIRWYKGWLQTWLVHMRDPARLWRELGPASFALTQILFLGTLLSVLIHPVALATVAWLVIKLVQSDVIVIPHVAMAVGGVASIVIGYGAFLGLGHVTLSRHERRQFWKVALLMPAYWLLLSVAAWRALYELYRRPHQWNKTRHQQVRPTSPQASTHMSGQAAKGLAAGRAKKEASVALPRPDLF